MERHQYLLEKFISKISIAPNSCWIWNGAVSSSGYGSFRYSKSMSAHRLSYETFNGVIPHGKIIMHKCDNRLCVNPEHLSVGTLKENMEDCSMKGRLNPKKTPVVQYTKNGQFVRGYKSIAEASRASGINIGNIFSCIKGKRKTASGFIWTKEKIK